MKGYAYWRSDHNRAGHARIYARGDHVRRAPATVVEPRIPRRGFGENPPALAVGSVKERLPTENTSLREQLKNSENAIDILNIKGAVYHIQQAAEVALQNELIELREKLTGITVERDALLATR